MAIFWAKLKAFSRHATITVCESRHEVDSGLEPKRPISGTGALRRSRGLAVRNQDDLVRIFYVDIYRALWSYQNKIHTQVTPSSPQAFSRSLFWAAASGSQSKHEALHQPLGASLTVLKQAHRPTGQTKSLCGSVSNLNPSHCPTHLPGKKRRPSQRPGRPFQGALQK